MKIHLTINDIFNLLIFFCGLTAAWYWYCASRIKITPNWENFMDGVVGKESQTYFEDLTNDINMTAWVKGYMIVFTKSAEMNARAAVWTAITAVLTVCTTIPKILGII